MKAIQIFKTYTTAAFTYFLFQTSKKNKKTSSKVDSFTDATVQEMQPTVVAIRSIRFYFKAKTFDVDSICSVTGIVVNCMTVLFASCFVLQLKIEMDTAECFVYS